MGDYCWEPFDSSTYGLCDPLPWYQDPSILVVISVVAAIALSFSLWLLRLRRAP